MATLSVDEILRATGGRLISGGKGRLIRGVSIDTRTLKGGELFFAIRGKRYDGHSFVKDAFARGAAGCVVEAGSQQRGAGEGLLIEVEDTVKALGELARAVRLASGVPLIAVTGTNGKTTTKDMIASVLKSRFRVHATEGNRNNTIGLPLTILSMPEDCQVLVVEMGINERGEMERLCHIAVPTVAVVTNIGRAHTEGLGKERSVAEEKLKLMECIGEDGVRVVNLDDPWIKRWHRKKGARVISFGRAKGATVRLKSIERSEGQCFGYYIIEDKMFQIRYNSPFTHNAYNGAAAIGAAMAVGMDGQEAAVALSGFSPPQGRMQLLKTPQGVTIIDDSYNANPSSFRAALGVLCAMEGRKILVLGEMAELGQIATEEHKRAGRLAAASGVDMVVAIGRYRMDVVEGAMAEGMDVDSVYPAVDNADAVAFLKEVLKPDDRVLVKGSRVARTEQIVAELKGDRG